MTIALAEFEQLLKETMGLDAVSIGSLSIERAVQERLTACGLDDTHAYWEQLVGAPAELHALIEAVVVRETWFFREKEAFSALLSILQQERLQQTQQTSQRMVRILSLPCATGEEPYSIAMALLDAGIPAERFCIDAVDISRSALNQARTASYGSNSFRGSDLGFRDRHFTPTAQGYQMSDAVCRQVRFQQGNIFAADFLPGAALYDVIFCRNVLIYFDRVMQGRAITVLARLLTKTGYLFVGSAETGLLASRGFMSAKMPLASAFCKTDAPPFDKRQPATAGKRPVFAAPPPKAVRIMPPAPLPASPVPRAATNASIEHATQLADQGRLNEAAVLCEQHIQMQGASPQWCHLMALIHDARGDRVQAIDYYRKVLYLDPQHSEALIHLACLLERQGEFAGARLLRARLDRINAKRGSR